MQCICRRSSNFTAALEAGACFTNVARLTAMGAITEGSMLGLSLSAGLDHVNMEGLSVSGITAGCKVRGQCGCHSAGVGAQAGWSCLRPSRWVIKHCW